MWNKLAALAVAIPMSMTIAYAQSAQDADITAYSQDLQMRIMAGQQAGLLSPANYNSVQSLYNNVEMIRRSLGNKPMPPMTRYTMMDSLTKLDQQLTNFLHDDANSRWQNWNPGTKTWRKNWWTGNNRARFRKDLIRPRGPIQTNAKNYRPQPKVNNNRPYNNNNNRGRNNDHYDRDGDHRDNDHRDGRGR